MKETLTMELKKKSTESTIRVSGAEAVIKCLLEEGANLAFGYPGGAIMPVYDEIYKYQDQLNHI